MASFYRYTWLILLIVQLSCIVYFFRGQTNAFGIYNRDAFSYHLQWSRASATLNPFVEPVLKDPGSDLRRIPFSIPHLFLGLTAQFLTPVQSYLFWCAVGVLLNYFSLYWFARVLGFSARAAAVASLAHYTLFHIVSQLPPLSFNQLDYVLRALKLDPETLLHFGPRQYPHDIFFYPLLFSVLGLTLAGIRQIANDENVSISWLVLWAILCITLPFNYFYHWLEVGVTLGVVFVGGLMLKWWQWHFFFRKYFALAIAATAVLAAWFAVIAFQNSQLSTPEGSWFALMGGLTEARFFLLPSGILVRIILWSVLLLAAIRLKPSAVLICAFLFSTILLMNMQVITGKNIQPGHWSFGIDRIFAWILILLFYSRIWPALKASTLRFLRPALYFLCVLFFSLQTYTSWKAFATHSRWDSDRVALVAYLNSLQPAVLLVPEIWLETDILIHTKHFGFLPRAAQSAIPVHEHLDRLTHAALLLQYSKVGFYKWLHTRPVRFFGMLYGTEKEFSSSLYFDTEKREEVLKFREGGLPQWDEKMIQEYFDSSVTLQKKLDYIILHKCEEVPSGFTRTVYENQKYIVVEVEPLKSKAWGPNMPIDEQKYPLYKTTCHRKEK